jgi:hypothetical protein
MEETLGFVLVEYNQASGRPSLWSDELYDDRNEASEAADSARAHTAKVGRRERYAVATVVIDHGEDAS